MQVLQEVRSSASVEAATSHGVWYLRFWRVAFSYSDVCQHFCRWDRCLRYDSTYTFKHLNKFDWIFLVA